MNSGPLGSRPVPELRQCTTWSKMTGLQFQVRTQVRRYETRMGDLPLGEARGVTHTHVHVHVARAVGVCTCHRGGAL